MKLSLTLLLVFSVVATTLATNPADAFYENYKFAIMPTLQKMNTSPLRTLTAVKLLASASHAAAITSVAEGHSRKLMRSLETAYFQHLSNTFGTFNNSHVNISDLRKLNFLKGLKKLGGKIVKTAKKVGVAIAKAESNPLVRTITKVALKVAVKGAGMAAAACGVPAPIVMIASNLANKGLDMAVDAVGKAGTKIIAKEKAAKAKKAAAAKAAPKAKPAAAKPAVKGKPAPKKTRNKKTCS